MKNRVRELQTSVVHRLQPDQVVLDVVQQVVRPLYARLRPLCRALHKGLYAERPVMDRSALASMLAAGIAAKNTLVSYS